MINRDALPAHAAAALLRKYGIVHPTLDNVIFLIEQYGYQIVDYDAEKLHGGKTGQSGIFEGSSFEAGHFGKRNPAPADPADTNADACADSVSAFNSAFNSASDENPASKNPASDFYASSKSGKSDASGISDIEKQLRTSMALTYSDDETRIVFLNDRLSVRDKCLLAAHELGHICLDHMEHGSAYRPVEEYEANEFVHYLFHPDPLTRLYCIVKTYRSETAKAVACFLLLLAGLFLGIHIVDSRIYCDSYYVCEHGEKYHLEDCLYVTGNSNSRRMTREEFDSGAYEPCKVCRPDT